jgi:hypothetical protein
MTIERDEFERFKADAFTRVNALERELGLLKQALDTHKDRMDERYDYNGRNHETMRADIETISKAIATFTPAIDWVVGLRQASKKVIMAIVIAGLLGLGSIFTKVLGLIKTAGGGLPGGP